MIGQSLVALVALASIGESIATAQENRWGAIMNLKTGTFVGVIAESGRRTGSRHHQICRVLSTSMEGLECAVVKADDEWLQEFPRAQILEIHSESIWFKHTYRSTLIGALIGGSLVAVQAIGEGAGAKITALATLYGGALGAAFGTLAGSGMTLRTKHGIVLYRP